MFNKIYGNVYKKCIIFRAVTREENIDSTRRVCYTIANVTEL